MTAPKAPERISVLGKHNRGRTGAASELQIRKHDIERTLPLAAKRGSAEESTPIGKEKGITFRD